ncbi:acetylornithine transaminase [Streptomonospora nanhaiensis]|uniref:Acetylornithine aminotransferase n=1 Tax=Streptomonospora nanhaiensis TaxID=1323731 RepID=A0A853BVT3_9ACTN|nr:acetylornithine transaminase [Streptomonospora nanhaiensis]MBV2364898.1 acetylornithine transaminase [Streptomonospora nanhaiensis]MBX9389848.1 acetylornithine transaminase [Streptomonospora nanhaiensis]NYI98845.1 acetylornithine aminotransferase [Streptomonospora nanhaiensis]
MSANDDLRARFEAVLMPNYGTPPIALARGEGRHVWDVDGNRYLDLIAGIAVSALGHGHPALVAAVADQTAALAHTSNLFLHEREVRLAERLVALLGGPAAGGGPRVFLANSGTEANEAALKLVRRAQGPARTRIVAAENGFHGRSLGALAVTGKAAIREPFGPFGATVDFVPFGDADALRAAVDDTCAAVVVEPLQGEAGVVPPPPGYLAEVRRVCDAAGAAMVLDEIQSGIGRTGRWFAHQAEGVVPDVLTLAKGLGGGLPIGACVGFGRYADAFAKGDHGSTFGGNPVACAAALAVLDTIEAEGLLANAAELGALLAARTSDLDAPLLAESRGAGLWRGLKLTRPAAAAVQERAAAHGFLVNAVAPDVVRVAPPLTITRDEVLEFTAALPAILKEAR